MFETESGTAPGANLDEITDRMVIRKAVQSGNVEEAVEKVNDLNPEVSEACGLSCCGAASGHPAGGPTTPQCALVQWLRAFLGPQQWLGGVWLPRGRGCCPACHLPRACMQPPHRTLVSLNSPAANAGASAGLRAQVLETQHGIFFHLQQQRLIELIRQGKPEEALDFAQEYLAPLAEEQGSFLEELGA